MKALMAGFDAVSNHIGLILFSVVLDLVLWLGPRLRLTGLSQVVLSQQADLPEASNTVLAEQLRLLVAEFNLLSALRTFPIGVPSLMAFRAPVQTPVGEPIQWEIPSLGIAFVVWALLTVVGVLTGALYFSVVAQAALSGKVLWLQALKKWPQASLQSGFLAVFWLALIFSMLLLLGCFMSFLLVGIGGLEQAAMFAVLIFGGLLVWLLIPLIFSPHGIFVRRSTMWFSVLNSARLTRMTMPSTTLLFLAFFVLSEGLRQLWVIPPEDSWLTLVGMGGHAFVTASLLAASFVYYRDADSWLQEVFQQRSVPTQGQ